MMNTGQEKALAWSKAYLASKGYQITGVEEIMVETPWSYVFRLPTNQGLIYLKKTPPSLFFEVAVTELFQKEGHIPVPEVIAVNTELHCFLSKACGDMSLQTYFHGQLNVELLSQGLSVYRNLQKFSLTRIDTLIKTGVPDWRLNVFTERYAALLQEHDLLRHDGVSDEQLETLKRLTPKLESLCRSLSEYGIAETWNHSDFHDNNMLIDTKTKAISIIDLGESSISHPFFSLAACLKNARTRYTLTLDDPKYIALKSACFNGFVDSVSNLDNIIELINILIPIYFTFGEIVLVKAAGQDAVNEFREKGKRQKNRIKFGLDAFIELIDNSKN